MVIYIITALVVIICAFIIGVYGYLTFMKLKQRRLWDELYAHIKSKFALLTDIFDIIKDAYANESEALKVIASCLHAFISAKTPSETVAAYSHTQAALHGLDDALAKYPLLYGSDAYVAFKNEMIGLDEKIAFTSQFYNESAAVFNARLAQLPFKAVAGIFNIGMKGKLDFKRQ